MTQLTDFLQNARLPVMPEVANRLIATLNQEYVELTYLRDVISKDPALTANVLRWANSPAHGLSRTVTTLDGAISILGISKIRAQAITLCLSAAVVLPKGISRTEFWNQSMRCAGYSMWFALAVGLSESEAWLTGLLLRLGEVLIAQWYKEQDGAAAANHETPPLIRWQHQRELMGFDEGQVMAKTAEIWCFPPEIVKALENSANPLSASKVSSLAAVVHMAAILAELPKVDDEALQALPPEVVSSLGIDLGWIAQYLPDPEALVDTSVL